MNPNDRLHDQWLVLRCQEGDAAALDQLIQRWQERLWRHALRLTGDEDAAWDILQEACLAIGRDLYRLADEASFPAWAYRIVSNKCRDWLRRTIRRRRWEEIFAAETQRRHEENHELLEKIADLKEALGRLPGPDRAILALRYEEEFSTREIAAILNIPDGTVKSRLYAAREKLRTLMEAPDNERL